MSKVYVVTSGSYSDYGIEAIFSTREKATEYMNGRGDCNEIEDYTLDSPPESWPEGWSVAIGEDGELRPERPPRRDDHNSPDMQPAQSRWYEKGVPCRVFIGWGETVEHARRSAEELRRQTLALEGKVITGS